MAILAVFAGAALVLATVGIYGVIAFTVTLRTHEIGIRVALGAMRSDILRVVLRQALVLALSGIAIGAAASVALTRIMSRMLFDVRPTDPATFAAVGILLASVATLAAYIPARGAMQIDPVVALRSE